MHGAIEFREKTPTRENYFRGVVLFGRNVASYKFALAKSIVELANQGNEAVSLDELARPFAQHLCQHLTENPRQATSASSKFLDACRGFNDCTVTEEQLHQATTRLGFVNVLDAFHTVGESEIPMRFFLDERRTATRGIRLTPEIQEIAAVAPMQAMAEIEARWRLVESAWSLGISRSLVSFENETGMLVSTNRHIPLTSARDALNGYQKGCCFYCYRPIGTTPEATDLADVDHLFPHVLQRQGILGTVDQVWNLVLACIGCNRGPGGKFASIPSIQYIERLNRRNEYLIRSAHPLRETLIS